MPTRSDGKGTLTSLLAWVALGLAAGLVALPALAEHQYQLDSLRINRPFARATPPGATSGAVFFTVDNAGNIGDRLVRASTPIAAAVAVHQMVLDNGVMRMRAVPSVELIPGARLEFSPNGYHLMLLDLKQPLKGGDRFPLTLTFEHGGAIQISVLVEGMGATEGTQ
jgi:periplasmic copper chaperone A